MPDIFSVSPPAWLTDLTRSNDKGLLGGIAGELLGGALIAGKKASEPESRQNWLQALPQSIAEAHLSVVDPMWKLKVQHSQMQIAKTGLALQEMQQKLNLGATNMRLRAEDTQEIPKWLAEHPTYESRRDAEWPTAKTPEWNRNLDQIRLRDSQSEQAKIAVSGVKAFTDRLSALSKDDPAGAAQVAGAAQAYTARGQPPPKEVTDALGMAEQVVAARKENERVQQQLRIEEAIKKAEAEGSTVGRTFGPKGESITIKPGTSAKETQPKILSLGGHQIIYNPKGGGFRVLNPEGKERQMTPNQLLSLSKALLLSPDKQSKQVGADIESFLSKTASKQITPAETGEPATKPSTAVPTSAPKRRVRVIGPGGQTGTVEEGDTLPEGWKLQP
jgi:hypothetical protein